ncbi:MAG: helix-turn-helix transcriptional regulator [Firmicutes bacterium]|nr:helix-turn-helix transcriptional regulator [Bacillota bacterium]
MDIWNRETLRSLRVKMGLTQSEVARRLGVSVRTLRRWERDASKVPFHHALEIAVLFRAPLQRIFWGPEARFRDEFKLFEEEE